MNMCATPTSGPDCVRNSRQKAKFFFRRFGTVSNNKSILEVQNFWEIQSPKFEAKKKTNLRKKILKNQRKKNKKLTNQTEVAPKFGKRKNCSKKYLLEKTN